MLSLEQVVELTVGVPIKTSRKFLKMRVATSQGIKPQKFIAISDSFHAKDEGKRGVSHAEEERDRM